MKPLYKITLLVLLIPAIVFGTSVLKKHERSKKISKSFKVNSKATVDIFNKYGNIYITTWDKNYVEFDIKITVKGNDLDKVERRLSQIDVQFNNSSDLVKAKTVIDRNKSSWKWWGNNNKISYKINYTVKMPKSNNVSLDNNYGSIALDELEGVANINCDYGKITVGELMNASNSINLDYCSRSTIAYAKNAKVNIDYSKLAIEKSGTIKLNTDYSSTEFGEVNDLTFNADYGSVSADDAKNVNGNSDYTSLRFGTIHKNLTISTDYGGLRVKKLAKTFENVSITGQYAGIKIGVAADANFTFEVDLQYAGFRYDKSNTEMYKSIVRSNKKHYEGKYGKGTSNAKIKIRSQYGSVSIKQNN